MKKSYKSKNIYRIRKVLTNDDETYFQAQTKSLKMLYWKSMVNGRTLGYQFPDRKSALEVIKWDYKTNESIWKSQHQHEEFENIEPNKL